MESAAETEGRSLTEYTVEELEVLWDRAKVAQDG
jgi:uncharacterized protein YabN with tetrapyrrole methylase and pyrophosphatase domain